MTGKVTLAVAVTAVLTLARGGRVFSGEDPAGSIVGGTGSYAGATGDFTETADEPGPARYRFRVQVPER